MPLLQYGDTSQTVQIIAYHTVDYIVRLSAQHSFILCQVMGHGVDIPMTKLIIYCYMLSLAVLTYAV